MRSALLVTERTDLAADLLILRAAERRLPIHRLNLDTFPSETTIVWSVDAGLRVASEGRCWGEDDIAGAWFRRMPASQAAIDDEARFWAREIDAFLWGVAGVASWSWMNHPAHSRRAECKPVQLQAAKRAGLDGPAAEVGNDPAAIRKLAARGPVIAKPASGGRLYRNGVPHVAFTAALDDTDLADDAPLRATPLIVQERVPAAFDLRVTVVNGRFFPVRIDVADRRACDTDWRAIDAARLGYAPVLLPASVQAGCSRLMEDLGLVYGAFDFIVTPEGAYRFLEVNPAGQWGWIERATSLPITDAILDALMERA